MSGALDGDMFELRHDKINPQVIGLRKIYNSSRVEVVPAWFKKWVTANKPVQQDEWKFQNCIFHLKHLKE